MIRETYYRMRYPPGTAVEVRVPNWHTHENNDRFFNTSDLRVRTVGMIGRFSVVYVVTDNAGIIGIRRAQTKVIRKLSEKEEFAARLKGLKLPDRNDKTLWTLWRPPK